MLKSLKNLKLIGYGLIIAGLIGSFSFSIKEGIKATEIKSHLKEQLFCSEQYDEFYQKEASRIDELFNNKQITKIKHDKDIEKLSEIDYYLNNLSQDEKEKYKVELEKYQHALSKQKLSLGLGAVVVIPGMALALTAEAKKVLDDEEKC